MADQHNNHRPSGEKKFDHHSGERRSYGKPEGRRGEGAPTGKKPYAGGRSDWKPGDKPTFGGEKRSFSGDKKPFRGEKPAFDGEKRSFSGEKRSFNSGKKPFDREKKPFGGENKPFSKEGRSFGGEKPSFSDDHKPFRGEGRPFDKDRKPMAGKKPDFRGVKKPVENKKPAAVSDGMPSRRIALQILREVTEKGAYASLLLDEKLTAAGLMNADRRLVSRLVYDTLEHLMYLDWVLSQVMAKPDCDEKLRNCLRLGACQILLEDRIPESAATNTTVNLCKEVFRAAGSDDLSVSTMASVCNGILRSLVRQKDHLNLAEKVTDPDEYRSIHYSVPLWLVKQLDRDYGREAADALMACRPQEEITLRPNLTRITDAEFEELLNKKVWEHEPASVPHAMKIRGMANIGSDADFIHGYYSIQGESSMMAAMALAPKRGAQVLDCCAAPGGKACFLGEMLDNTGRVQAWELHPHRTELIAAQARRLQLDNVRPITRDASIVREEMSRTMDAVLLDAPCSGLGTMADKPDIKLRITEESVQELTALQAKLLDSVSTYVKPGGVLVYSTCSLLKSENVDQITRFLADHPDFKLDPLPETIPEQFRKHEDIGLQLLPSRDGVGGFYLCRMKRSRV